MKKKQTIVATIAGSDSGGGAGIQADLATFRNFDVHGCSVITAVTAQNSVAVNDVFIVPAESIEQQLATLADDLMPSVIKLGMQGDCASLRVVADFLQNYLGKVVCDPVLFASTGRLLLDAQQVFLHAILPRVDVLTPNIQEAEWLSSLSINDYADVEQAALKILALGVKSVVITGGHADDKQFSQDYFTDGQQSCWLSNERINNPNTHGSGCAFSAALAASLALGHELLDAVVLAKLYLQQSIRYAIRYGAGPGPVAHIGSPSGADNLPYLTRQPLLEKPQAFASCADRKIGIYAIVDSANWVRRVAENGIRTVQLRIKDRSLIEVESEVKQAVDIANRFDCRLFINDYWQLALKYHAYGVHLGQEDLLTADIAQLRSAGLRLGVSTHCFYEVAIANAVAPSYFAVGPVFPTTSKEMKFGPQGLLSLWYWRRVISAPLVAIGGINAGRVAGVWETGVDGVAMISAITQAQEPEKVMRELLAI